MNKFFKIVGIVTAGVAVVAGGVLVANKVIKNKKTKLICDENHKDDCKCNGDCNCGCGCHTNADDTVEITCDDCGGCDIDAECCKATKAEPVTVEV